MTSPHHRETARRLLSEACGVTLDTITASMIEPWASALAAHEERGRREGAEKMREAAGTECDQERRRCASRHAVAVHAGDAREEARRALGYTPTAYLTPLRETDVERIASALAARDAEIARLRAEIAAHDSELSRRMTIHEAAAAADARGTALRAVVEAARLRAERRHNDTCDAEFGDYPCSCGRDALRAALSALDAMTEVTRG